MRYRRPATRSLSEATAPPCARHHRRRATASCSPHAPAWSRGEVRAVLRMVMQHRKRATATPPTTEACSDKGGKGEPAAREANSVPAAPSRVVVRARAADVVFVYRRGGRTWVFSKPVPAYGSPRIDCRQLWDAAMIIDP